jgi:hypothetical protein
MMYMRRPSLPVSVPFFKDPRLNVTVEQALPQAALHSHYHRARFAPRIRAKGIDPPATDFIVWLWKGHPPAA